MSVATYFEKSRYLLYDIGEDARLVATAHHAPNLLPLVDAWLGMPYLVGEPVELIVPDGDSGWRAVWAWERKHHRLHDLVLMEERGRDRVVRARGDMIRAALVML